MSEAGRRSQRMTFRVRGRAQRLGERAAPQAAVYGGVTLQGVSQLLSQPCSAALRCSGQCARSSAEAVGQVQGAETTRLTAVVANPPAPSSATLTGADDMAVSRCEQVHCRAQEQAEQRTEPPKRSDAAFSQLTSRSFGDARMTRQRILTELCRALQLTSSPEMLRSCAGDRVLVAAMTPCAALLVDLAVALPGPVLRYRH